MRHARGVHGFWRCLLALRVQRLFLGKKAPQRCEVQKRRAVWEEVRQWRAEGCVKLPGLGSVHRDCSGLFWQMRGRGALVGWWLLAEIDPGEAVRFVRERGALDRADNS